jgi:hypothetical protein
VEWRYHESMATFRISEADAARDFNALLARVRAGEEVIIESGLYPAIVVRTLGPPARTLEEIVAALPKDDSMRMGPDFADDVEIAIAATRQPMNPPDWE